MPSLFGALDTAVTGLTAQSAAFSNISDNVANSQSTGFKRTDTTFADYLSTSTAVTNDSGSVVARPEYQNETQGTISASSDPLALAIGGQGFFQVTQQTGNGNNTTLSSSIEYTRNGNFTLNKDGYLVNSSQQVLDGWLTNPTTGVIDKSQQLPIKVSQSPYPAVATANINLSANLPALTYVSGATNTVASSVNIYDAKGTLHTLDLTYAQTGTDNWTVSITSPDDTAGNTALGSAQIQFGSTASGNGNTTTIPAGTIGTLGSGSNQVSTPSTTSAGSPANLTLTCNFGEGSQVVSLNFGTYGGTSGLTQYAGTGYAPHSLSQDGLALGNYTGTTTQSNGNVVNTYDNGKSTVVAEVPVALFANANELQRQNGQSFETTSDSGLALVQDIASSGSSLATSSIEGSNVDIASEFTKLIVTQQAYAANSKVITTANDMLTQTIDMKR